MMQTCQKIQTPTTLPLIDYILYERGLLWYTIHVCLEEQVVIFLNTIGQPPSKQVHQHYLTGPMEQLACTVDLSSMP